MSLNSIDLSVSDNHNHRSYAGILRWCCLALSVLFFAVSLPCDGFYTGDKNQPNPVGPGYFLLIIGLLGVADGHFAWLANPALLIAWLSMGLWRMRYISLKFSLIAVALALSFLLHRTILANEGGARDAIVGYGTGYVLWLVSMVLALCGSYAGTQVNKSKNSEATDSIHSESESFS